VLAAAHLVAPLLLAASVGPSSPRVATPPSPVAIYGGRAAQPCEWPSVVALDTGCSGVLVSSTHVLTAAHCFGPQYAWLGEDLGAPAHEVEVEACTPYPGGEPGQANDLMVCTLAQPQAVPPSTLLTAEEAEALEVGLPVMLVGFGESEDGSMGIKRVTSATLGPTNDRGERSIGGEGRDTCSGDSGGPAFAWIEDLGWRVVGITSYGFECGDGGWYTQPHLHEAWLDARVVTDWCASPSGEPPARADWSTACRPPPEDDADPCEHPESSPGCMVHAARDCELGIGLLLCMLGLRHRSARARGRGSGARPRRVDPPQSNRRPEHTTLASPDRAGVTER